MSVSIKFLGATKTVTGSCYLVTHHNIRFLVDCGMFQGPDVESRNLDDLDFDASQIDFVLLTHAHLDHVGLIPKLTRNGFKGPIYATFHTAQIAEIIMLDSAKIQEANYSKGIAWQFSGKVQLIYDTKDAMAAVEQLQVVEYDEQFYPADGVAAKYTFASHILGAASIELEVDGKRIVFSGDIGRRNHDLIGQFDPDYRYEADYVVMESLYGGQLHPPRPESVNQLTNIIKDTIQRGGSVYIPCFAVQRTQELINDFKLAAQSGALPQDVQVWLDSPMAQKVTEIYSQALDFGPDSLFNFNGMRYVKHYRQSAKLTNKRGVVVIAGSGMANGGRIMNHIAANIKDKRNSIVFVGYQAEGTLGRDLVEGQKDIQIENSSYRVGAEIHYLQGFSAHADDQDLKTWLNRYNSPRLKRTFLVHAEPERSQVFFDSLTAQAIDHPYIPDWKEEVTL